jgi:preprotein translocase subunit SecA
VREVADEALAAKETEYDANTWALVERLVLLRTIDSLWVEHLTELDDMRRGIGLRGYGGEDPLNAFRKEAFRLYEELRGFIRHGVASTIFKVNVQRDAPPPFQSAARAQPAAAGAADGDGNGRRPQMTVGAAAGSSATAAAPLVAGLSPVRSSGVQATHGERPAVPARAPGSPKIGRNDPCYCGSGLKYKKCHGR